MLIAFKRTSQVKFHQVNTNETRTSRLSSLQENANCYSVLKLIIARSKIPSIEASTTIILQRF